MDPQIAKQMNQSVTWTSKGTQGNTGDWTEGASQVILCDVVEEVDQIEKPAGAMVKTTLAFYTDWSLALTLAEGDKLLYGTKEYKVEQVEKYRDESGNPDLLVIKA